jgi:hypothetical protein
MITTNINAKMTTSDNSLHLRSDEIKYRTDMHIGCKSPEPKSSNRIPLYQKATISSMNNRNRAASIGFKEFKLDVKSSFHSKKSPFKKNNKK